MLYSKIQIVPGASKKGRQQVTGTASNEKSREREAITVNYSKLVDPDGPILNLPKN